MLTRRYTYVNVGLVLELWSFFTNLVHVWKWTVVNERDMVQVRQKENKHKRLIYNAKNEFLVYATSFPDSEGGGGTGGGGGKGGGADSNPQSDPHRILHPVQIAILQSIVCFRLWVLCIFATITLFLVEKKAAFWQMHLLWKINSCLPFGFSSLHCQAWLKIMTSFRNDVGVLLL